MTTKKNQSSELNTNGQNTETEEFTKLEETTKTADSTSSIAIQRPDDTSHVSEIIREKLIEALEPTEVITETISPKDSFIPFEQTQENTIVQSNEMGEIMAEIEPKEQTETTEQTNEIEAEQIIIPEEQETEIQQEQIPEPTTVEQTEEIQQEPEEQNSSSEKQNVSDEDFAMVLRNDSKEITLGSEGYIYMNVMETFVKEVIVDYMKQYASCTCNHCIVDTMALALTNLPSKYIVVKKGSLAPLINMYRTKYSTQISTEVLKACLAVGNSPHHEKK